MKVLAIDPGYDRMGVAILERQAGQDTLLFSTCIETDKKAELPDRLLQLGTELTSLCTKYNPDLLAIETLFFNKNVKTALGVAQARGVALFVAKQYGCTICEYGPQTIKVAMTGYGNSDKTAVIHMVQKLVQNVPETALDDEYDAIAVGVTALAHAR
jgi:crossover junction endodeoxyribonuclease RuvC